MKYKLIRAIAVGLAAIALTVTTGAKAAGIAVRMDPSDISLGEAAQLTVTIQGRENISPEIPAVDGLSFEPVGQSSQISIVNGTMTANISHTFAVIPDHAGNFTIPPIKAGRGREQAISQPVVLKVVPSGRGTAARPARGGGNQSGLPAPKIIDGEESGNVPDQTGFGFLRIISPKKEFYVGEMVPVELRACFRAGVELRVDGLPQLNSDAFAMNKLGDEPARSQQIIDGVPYTVFSWPTTITAVKAGEYELSIKIPTTVTVRQSAARPRARGGNPFGDDPFADMFDDTFFNQFFGRTKQKQVELSSQPSKVNILSLPDANRPEHFAGAVGTFDITAAATPTRTAAGDPVTLKVAIRGRGNFDRVSAPGVTKSDTWKPYQPGAKFVPADNTGYSGEKTFEQALVPLHSGQQEIPALAFSYFDPEQKQYVSRTTTPIQIEVAPGPLPIASTSPAGPDSLPATAALPANSASAPAESASGHPALALPSWLVNPWLMGSALALALSAFATVYFIRRQRRLARDPGNILLAETRAAVATQIQIMESAVARGAALNFFAAARRALQIQLGRRWNLPPQTITQAEINSRLPDEAGSIRPVFETADEVFYTGRAVSAEELRGWHDSVQLALAKLD